MLLSAFLAPVRASGDPLDDRYYPGPGSPILTSAGVTLTNERALRIGTVWRAVNVLAASIAVLPIGVFRRMANGGKELLRDHPAYRLLHKPNAAQTSYRWRHHLMGTTILGGNYYAAKVPGQLAAVGQLWPLDAERMTVEAVNRDGTLSYTYTDAQLGRVPYRQDELLHVRGFTLDGRVGLRLVDMMRESAGASLAAEAHAANFLRQAARPSVVLKVTGGLTDPARERLRADFARVYSGPSAAGRIPVLEGGMTIEPFQMTNRDTQYLESRQFQVEDLLRFLGVPGVLVGYADKTATYASAEQFFQSFVTHGVFPWARNLEDELAFALLEEDEREELIVEFNLEALLRPDSKARAEFYRTMIELGVYTRNEVRIIENRNPLPGLDEPLTPLNMARTSQAGAEDPGLDEPLTPLNMARTSQAGAEDPEPAAGAGGQADQVDEGDAEDAAAAGRRPRTEAEARAVTAAFFATLARRPGLEAAIAAHLAGSSPAPAPAPDPQLERARALVLEAAARVVRKEVAAIAGTPRQKGAAARYAADAAGWRRWLETFYQEHAALVREALLLEQGQAEAWCREQLEAVLVAGVGIVETWEAQRAPALAALAWGAAAASSPAPAPAGGPWTVVNLAPQITVAPPAAAPVHVELPRPGRRVVERDDAGRITGLREEA